MTTLKGTEKQISWANEIRAKHLEIYNNNKMAQAIENTLEQMNISFDKFVEMNEKAGADEKAMNQVKRIFEYGQRILNEENAAWFIDNQNMSLPLYIAGASFH